MKRLLRAIVPRRLWTQLRMLRLHFARACYRRRRVRHNYGGYDLELELIDAMGAGWYDRDWPELPEIALLKRHGLRRGARVFDIGAHQGVVAMMLARTVGAEGLVVAVEANRENYEAACLNLKVNGIDNCRVVHAAGAARSGSVIFNRGPNGQVDSGDGEWGRIEVRAVSIDDLAGQYGVPDVLFIDVEGFECALLEGAQKTFVSRPDCFVEVHVGAGLETFGGSVKRVLSLFPDGYRFFIAPPDGAFGPMKEDSAELTQRFFLIAIHGTEDSKSERVRRPESIEIRAQEEVR